MKRTGLTLLAVAAAALMIVLLPAGGAIAGTHHHGNHQNRHDKKKGGKKNKGKTYKSKVGDDYFSPAKLKIHTGDKVKWKWDATNSDSHNVTLTKGPRAQEEGLQEVHLGDRLARDQVQAHVQEEGHLHLHLHDPPDHDARDRQGQEVTARWRAVT